MSFVLRCFPDLVNACDLNLWREKAGSERWRKAAVATPVCGRRLPPHPHRAPAVASRVATAGGHPTPNISSRFETFQKSEKIDKSHSRRRRTHGADS